MTRLQVEATGIIFDNIENIIPYYQDFEETKKSLARLKRYLIEKFERQGFCFGYWFAAELIGNGQEGSAHYGRA